MAEYMVNVLLDDGEDWWCSITADSPAQAESEAMQEAIESGQKPVEVISVEINDE